MKQGLAAWISVSALMTAMVAVMIWKWPADSGQWASWAQAIGTVAALFGVLWISHADTRRERDEQLAIAAVSAAMLMQTLPDVLSPVVAGREWLANQSPEHPENVLNGFRQMRDRLERAPLPTEEHMLRLIPIDPALGRTLAHSVASLTQARAALTLNIDAQTTNPQQLAIVILHLNDVLLNAAEIGLRWCSAQLDEFNTPPPH